MPLDRYLLTRLCTYIESLTKPLISVRFYRIIDWFLQNLQNIIFRAYFISFFSSPCLRLPSSLMILGVWSTTRLSLGSLQASLREADFIQLKFNSLGHWIHNPRLPFQDSFRSIYEKFVRNQYIKLRHCYKSWLSLAPMHYRYLKVVVWILRFDELHSFRCYLCVIVMASIEVFCSILSMLMMLDNDVRK